MSHEWWEEWQSLSLPYVERAVSIITDKERGYPHIISKAVEEMKKKSPPRWLHEWQYTYAKNTFGVGGNKLEGIMTIWFIYLEWRNGSQWPNLNNERGYQQWVAALDNLAGGDTGTAANVLCHMMAKNWRGFQHDGTKREWDNIKPLFGGMQGKKQAQEQAKRVFVERSQAMDWTPKRIITYARKFNNLPDSVQFKDRNRALDVAIVGNVEELISLMDEQPT